MTNMNVFAFFLIGTLSFAFLAFRFLTSKAQAFRMFGTGLALFAVAFGIWAAIVYTQPTDLATMTTLGVIPFGLANLFFVAAGTSDFGSQGRRILLGVAAVVLTALFVIRTFSFPSAPSINADGYFYFNADPIAIMLYVIVFAGALMPAVHIVTLHTSHKQTGIFTRLFFNVVTLSGVVLLVSVSDDLQYLNGYVMLLGLIGLVVTHARKSPEYIAH
jgi:hypothetical protein